ncbi:MAG TPA: YggT family protein [Candidatus Aminicenantes bacterium]|nr:YggT family protein [Candidatus Aminicenantes bacterium]
MILGTFLKATAQLVHTVFQIYILVVIIRSLLSWFGPLPYNPLIQLFRRLTDPLFRLAHRLLPFLVMNGIDLSPIVVLLLLYFADTFVTDTLLGLAARAALGGAG